MARLLGRFLMLLLLVLPTTIMFAGNDGGSSLLVGAEEPEMDGEADEHTEDVVEGEEEGDGEAEAEGDATVETDEGQGETGEQAVTEGEEEEEAEAPLKASPDANTYLLFTQPKGMEFPAGNTVKFLVGFTNTGEKEFTVDTLEASFRYPQDYSYYIQNFTTVRFDRLVESTRQATFEYSFTPSESFNARPFGLSILLNYRDIDGNLFQDAVFNSTVNIIEPDEGLDGETFFLYLFLAAIAVLLLVGAQQLLATYGVRTFGKKHSSKPRAQMEMGTQNKGDIDMDWIPQETINATMKRSPGRSPKQSPRQRRTLRSGGSDAD